MEDFLNIINICWEEEDYYSYFREIGTKIKIKFENKDYLNNNDVHNDVKNVNNS